jgi:hypothetical protein
MRVFEKRANPRPRNDGEPQRRLAAKSRSERESCEGKKSLNGKVFGAANESLF